MAKGPTWSDYEDAIVEAGRAAGLPYKLITVVMPHRSPNACMVRTNILRRQAGQPSRHRYGRLNDDNWQADIRKGSDMLLAAMRRAHCG